MPNMSHCRFTNTLADLRECREHLWDDDDSLAPEEKKARDKLVRLCWQIGQDYEPGDR